VDIDLLEVSFSQVVCKIFNEAQMYFYVPWCHIVNFKFSCSLHHGTFSKHRNNHTHTFFFISSFFEFLAHKLVIWIVCQGIMTMDGAGHYVAYDHAAIYVPYRLPCHYFVQLSDESSSTGLKYLLYFPQIIFNHAVLNDITVWTLSLSITSLLIWH
jgi:hypothetical protein